MREEGKEGVREGDKSEGVRKGGDMEVREGVWYQVGKQAGREGGCEDNIGMEGEGGNEVGREKRRRRE